MTPIIFDCERMKYANTGLYYYCLNLWNAFQQQEIKKHMSVFAPNHVMPVLGRSMPCLSQHSLQKFFMPSVSQYRLWHATYQSSQYLPCRNRKIKVVLTIHDLNFLYEDRTNQKKARCLRQIQQNIDRSDAIVCISEFIKNDVLTHCNTTGKPIYMIYNGTNELEHPLLEAKSYRPATPFLFNIGTIARKKNQHQILPLLQSNPTLELVLAGRHEDKEYAHFIKRRAWELNVEDRMHFVHEISDQEKSWYYHNCLAVIVPSLAEGFGLPVTEAMSVGKPVFLSKHTALPEIGKDFAFYFHDFDNMQHDFMTGMHQYQQAGIKLSEALKTYSTTFSWLDSAKRYVEVYQSLI